MKPDFFKMLLMFRIPDVREMRMEEKQQISLCL
jgi:hypothetical protein